MQDGRGSWSGSDKFWIFGVGLILAGYIVSLWHTTPSAPSSSASRVPAFQCPAGARYNEEIRGEPDRERYLEAGDVVASCRTPDGKLHGNVMVWTPAGVKVADTYFWNDVTNGPGTVWYRSGRLRLRGNALAGKPHGTAESFFESGRPESIIDFFDGLPHGRYIEWHENGRQKEESTAAHGKRNGRRRIWDENGVLVLDRDYLNDVIQVTRVAPTE